MKNSNPLIVVVGGFPRAGTRQFCNLINQIPSCYIQGEMDVRPYSLLADFVQEIDRIIEGKTSGYGLRIKDAFQNRRNEAVLETYRLFSKTGKNVRPDWDELKVTGLKKPLVEVSHRQTKAIFEPSNESIVHFYCLRGIYSNFNSLAGAFGYTVPRYKQKISESISGLQEMVCDDFFEVKPLHLESFINSDGASWVQENLFNPIGINIPTEDVDKAIAKTRGANRTPDAKRRSGVTEEEMAELTSDKEFVENVRWLEQHFGISLL